MVSPSDFDFHRQRIVVADDASPAAAFLIDTLRVDGHRVTQLSDARSVGFDLALEDCHLFICGSAIGGRRAVELMTDLRDTLPDVPILCVAAALRWTRRLEGMLPAGVTILREPLTAAGLRAAVRSLLPLGGTTLAWRAMVLEA